MLCDMYSVGVHSLRTVDVFTVVASLPSKDKIILKIKLFFGGREATTGNKSAVRRLGCTRITTEIQFMCELAN